MNSIPNLTHCLIDPEERAWAASVLLRRRASATAMAISSSAMGVSSAPVAVISSPERLSLMVSTPVLDQLANGDSHLLRSRNHQAEVEPLMGNMGRGGVAEAAGRGDLGARRRVARTGESARR